MATNERLFIEPRPTQRIGVIVVHGVGEQRRFEHLESIASNFHKALLHDSAHHAHVDVQSNADDDSTPVVVRWRGQNQTQFEAHFREVYWADLDEQQTLWNWLKLVGWAIAMPGVRRFSESYYESGAWPEMRSPRPVGNMESMWVRLQLFIISLLFLIMLISVDVGYWLLRRLSFSPDWLARVRFLIYDHLGDVKLYQDWFRRRDENIEVHGERSRVAIRRRMVKVLVQTARDVHEGRLDGYYVIGHSLGSVVAFNGLMEHGHVLPNYLSLSEWNEIPVAFKQRLPVDAPNREIPIRPPWLHPFDAIDRRALFSGLRGFLTLGSPLNKFATLWPALVPVNDDPVFNEVPWINVADCQDVVAGKISLFAPHDDPHNLAGLKIHNIEWSDQWTIATAHTRYWKAGRRRKLIDALVPWFEGRPFRLPRGRLTPAVAYSIYNAALVVLAFTPLLILAYMTWLLHQAPDFLPEFMNDWKNTSDLLQWTQNTLAKLVSIPGKSLYGRTVDTIFYGSLIVMMAAFTRHVWERWRFRPQRKAV